MDTVLTGMLSENCRGADVVSEKASDVSASASVIDMSGPAGLRELPDATLDADVDVIELTADNL